ncbi:MAG: U32 family peptidase [Defluviitaleaceae bacterium]|nr:U32 family peptidase [Defluviitaleaceae bacterium]
MMNKKIELLAPAGDLEKLHAAINYGADAIYMGGKSLGLRAKAKNFDFGEIAEAVFYAHSHKAKIYITANIFAHNDDFEGIEEYLLELGKIGVDALIVSDPGIFSIAHKVLPEMDIHISTQANVTNKHSVEFWQNQGAKRIVLARELSIIEIKEIHDSIKTIDTSFELESFVHGSMCISYSGRCLLSNYMTGKDANRGECTHPCRWKYNLMEENRRGEYLPVFEDERGTYIFNSKDLCMVPYLPELIEAGVESLKIEGRMKSAYYVALVTGVYRQALDDFLKDSELYTAKIPYYLSELKKASHRDFTTGFYFGKTTSGDQVYTNSSYVKNYDFVGIVKSYDEENNLAKIEQRNKFSIGDEIEIMRTNGDVFTQLIEKIYDEKMGEIESAPHPQQIVYIETIKSVGNFDMLRKRL